MKVSHGQYVANNCNLFTNILLVNWQWTILVDIASTTDLDKLLKLIKSLQGKDMLSILFEPNAFLKLGLDLLPNLRVHNW